MQKICSIGRVNMSEAWLPHILNKCTPRMTTTRRRRRRRREDFAKIDDDVIEVEVADDNGGGGFGVTRQCLQT